MKKISVKTDKIINSIDNASKKYIQFTNDGYRLETLYVDYHNKYIICFSSQIGCSLGCKFCYNGIRHNYKRNLTSKEICDQIENVIHNEKIKKDKPILFSAMGIGEPLLNYDNLVETFLFLENKYPGNKFALATTGINLDNIIKLAKDMQDIKNFKLTISLHSANPKIRKKLIPISKDLEKLVDIVKKYKKLSKREVEWNYVLFNGINDSLDDAKSLYNLLGKEEYIKINRFNPVDISKLTESKNKESFIQELKKYGMQVEYYETNGVDINGACGQMISD